MLKQKEKEKNWEAIKTFLQNCYIVVDNGNTTIFNAQGVYIAKTKGETIRIPSCNMSYGTNTYGGMSLCITSLNEKSCFTEFSTDFNEFKYENGVLKITGKDASGTGKGDYEINLIP
jgi:hypothetical protein